MTYTKEQLEPIVASNISTAGVIRDLGLHQSGGNHSHLRRIFTKFGISIAHFKGQGANFGANHKGGCQKKSPKQILVLRKEHEPRTHGKRLRQALIESGRPDKCEDCGQEPTWNDRALVLTPDHQNGKFWDNRPSNLKLLCPNCHSQTSTFCGRKNGSCRNRQTKLA